LPQYLKGENMVGGVRIPVRVGPRPVSERAAFAAQPEVAKADPPVTDRDEAIHADSPVVPARSRLEKQDPATSHREPEGGEEKDSADEWRDRALRLQAEMDNFRKRQQRLADERVSSDRERLLRAFLGVADDLERALRADGTDVESLRQGVDLTYQSLLRVLNQEGAEPIEAVHQTFDPQWHEAVATVPHKDVDVEPDTVVEVVQVGYRLGDRLLRPARVLVAT
jgi:molecular chaperone GrpE